MQPEPKPKSLRAQQLDLLRDCELPKDAKDSKGYGVSGVALKAVLVAIDQFGRGRPGQAYASVGTIAKTANIGRRTATRAVQVLEALGLICKEQEKLRQGRRGANTNHYTIVWSELAIRRDRSPLARWADHSAISDQTQSATGPDHSAMGADQSATTADHSAMATDQSATGGARNVSKRQEAKQEAPSDVSAGEDEDGARYFFEDEIAAVREKANRIYSRARTRTLTDRELVLKIAVLWADGHLSDCIVEEVLESFKRKSEAGDPVRNAMGWLWRTIENQCIEHGIKFQRLLARCEFPRELLLPPAERVEACD